MTIGLCHVPSLLGDVLAEALHRRPAVRVVPDPIRLPTAGTQVVKWRIDTLIVVVSHGDGRRLATQLSREVPRLRVVVVARDRQAIVVHHPPQAPRTVHNPSLDRFLDVIGHTEVAD